jgi:hypothetical protein
MCVIEDPVTILSIHENFQSGSIPVFPKIQRKIALRRSLNRSGKTRKKKLFLTLQISWLVNFIYKNNTNQSLEVIAK